MTNPDSILKGRDITLARKIHLVKALVFPVVMYICAGWTIKKVGCWRCFPTVVLEETLESLLDCEEVKPVNPKGNQSWIFMGRTDAELKLYYFGHLMWRTDSLEKTLTLGKIAAGGEGDSRRWDGWMASLTQWTWVWASSGSWWWTGKPGVLQSMGSQRVGRDWVTELNWLKINISCVLSTFLRKSICWLCLT